MLALGQMLRLLAWAAALSAIVCAQAPTIRTDVPLVVVPTSVTDKKGHYIPDLTDADFLPLWQGPQRVILFVPAEKRQEAIQRLPDAQAHLLAESGGKAVYLNHPPPGPSAPDAPASGAAAGN